uniref:DNA polymerase epsilon subunit D n=1 Tax=Fusarium clavum TaxID=2594811 RepID=A0A090MGH4_9HYPO|nr:unnamed protein product [Fusarium clavum]
MPPRKSNSRKSDTSTARFVPMDDVSPLEQSPAAPAPTQADAPAPASATATAPAGSEIVAAEGEAGSSPDLTLPKSIITRLSKGVLPPNTQIQANAIMALSQSTTVFINYLASHANENTVNAGKKTISPADVFKALEETEFGFLREPLEAEFAKFNAIQTEKRTSYRQKVRAKKSDGADTDMPDTSHVETDADTTIASTGPLAKRPRVEPGNADAEEDAVTEDEWRRYPRRPRGQGKKERERRGFGW